MIGTLGLVVAFIAAYWVYNDARGRGHELGTALLWSLGTLAALVIFLPLYLLFGRKPAMTGAGRSRREEIIIDVESAPVEETMNCPMCGGKVKEDYKACPFCSFTLKPKCQSCDRELNREWKTCPYCQAPTVHK